MFSYPFMFILLTNHEPCYVLQEQQGDLPLAAQFNEVGGFEGCF